MASCCHRTTTPGGTNHEETRIPLRLPGDLHAWLTTQAKANRRSLNAETVHRIKGEHHAAVADAEAP
ncbi:toxin-antitoxin system HicB family antitoxin [Streptomyces sp. NPDC002688]|uniref:toxin-antitoxin system HicB family antitoxin n=1 Tax=Streptomyces sp. NPDC002688 TaxID=3154423 RepID=UPI0033342F8D